MTAPLTATDRTLVIDEDAADVLFREAHTAYGFTDMRVTEEQIAGIVELVRFAPTGMNSQPLRVIIVRSDEARSRLLPHLAEGNRARGQSAPVIAILAADTDFHERLGHVFPQAPGAREMFADDTVREQAARFNATLQAGYFILAVRAAGLSAGPMGGFDAAGVDRDLLGDGSLRSILLVNIGTPAEGGTYPRNPRLSLDEVVSTI